MECGCSESVGELNHGYIQCGACSHESCNVIIAEVHVILVDNVMVSHHKLIKRKCLKVV